VLERCSFMQAMRALTVLLGLTWVVSLACLRGLYSREGVFLRTPKQGDVARLGDSFAVVRWETFLGFICLAMAATLLYVEPFEWFSARAVIIMLLVWQSAIFFAALLSSLWDYQVRKNKAPPLRLSFHTLGYTLSRAVPERRIAVWIGVGILVLAQLTYLSIAKAPQFERIFRADPLKHFIAAPSVLSANLQDKAGALLIMESDTAQRGDVESALLLWNPNGVIVDENFTPDDKSDDRVWRGIDGLHERYREEFSRRHYLLLLHPNMDIRIDGEYATIVNDVDTVIVNGDANQPEHVRLRHSDRWKLQYIDGRWQIMRLEVNRAPRTASGQTNDRVK